MPHYLWKGVDVHGHPVEGAIESADKSLVLDELRKHDIFKVRFNRVLAYKLQFPLQEELLVRFLAQLHRLLESGLEFVDCLSFIIRYQNNALFSYILCSLRKDIQEGKSLSAAFRRYEAGFPSIFLHLIEVAENSGKLLDVLKELLDFFSFQNRFAQEQRKLITYPLVVFFIALLLFIGILLFIVPVFKTMFLSSASDLPWSTMGLIVLSDSLRHSPQYWVIGSIGAIVFVLYVHRSFGWGWLLRFIPGFHTIEESIRLLFYARSMMISLKAGTQLREALSLGVPLFPKRLQNEVRMVHDQIDAGKSLVDAYSTSKLFPPLFVHLVAVGESSGHLAPTFERIAALYQERIERRMNFLNSLIEPVFTLVLAVGILVVLLSIYLPIFSIAEHF
ncbi:MAG: type II secretion system F family protein [SAR324 cluster bacterium]|nr:type II secretion system F family protein [SAR324 cluster bacterium]